MNKVILLDRRPVGVPTSSDFKFIEEEIPGPAEGEILLKTLYVSVDPYLRGKMRDVKSYTPPFELNKPLQSALITEVIASKHNEFKVGDFYLGYLDWKEYQISSGEGLIRVDGDVAPLSAYLGILGMTGLTAYLGLKNIGNPKAGETLIISGAAGAVGSVVGQIGKLLGCNVVGLAGSEEKVNALTSIFHFDHAINYKNADLATTIQNVCPDGVDIYFDNVGGSVSDAVLANLRYKSRIIVCGSISSYNETEPSFAPRIEWRLIVNSASMCGFIVGDYRDQFPEGMEQLKTWYQEGKLINRETVIEGFDQIPQAFIDLFEGKNEGKMIVKI
jgi:NADPH-dependent curcumin reductase CurA